MVGYITSAAGVVADPATGSRSLKFKIGTTSSPGLITWSNLIPKQELAKPLDLSFDVGVEGKVAVSVFTDEATTALRFSSRDGIAWKNEVSDKVAQLQEAIDSGAPPLVIDGLTRAVESALKSMPSGSGTVSLDVTIPVRGVGVRELRAYQLLRQLDGTTLRPGDLPDVDGSANRFVEQVRTLTPPVISSEELGRAVSSGRVIPENLPRVDPSTVAGLEILQGRRLPESLEATPPPVRLIEINLPRDPLDPAYDVPNIPALDSDGNPIVVDLPGPTSGVMGMNPEGELVLIELPDDQVGPPTLLELPEPEGP